MIAMVILCIYLTQKYNIKVTNIPELSQKLPSGTLVLAIGFIIFSVVKSFALIFPPAVVFSICAYMIPNVWLALIINVISVFLSLSIPYVLGRFTGAGMEDTLKNKIKAIKNVGEQPWVVAIPVVVIIVFTLIAGAITKKLIEKTKAAKENL